MKKGQLMLFICREFTVGSGIVVIERVYNDSVARVKKPNLPFGFQASKDELIPLNTVLRYLYLGLD